MLDNPLLIRWFGKNAYINHPKLDSLPIGLKRHNFRQGFESFLRHASPSFDRHRFNNRFF